jgi:hypothetical protein
MAGACARRLEAAEQYVEGAQGADARSADLGRNPWRLARREGGGAERRGAVGR